jgi:hypothetical protein
MNLYSIRIRNKRNRRKRRNFQITQFVVLRGEAGELGIMPGHTPLLTRRNHIERAALEAKK